MANQYTSQLLETIRNAIFGNIGSIFSFTIGYDDAKVIANQFKEMVTTNDLISLPRFTAYTRMMINGVTSDPFSMKTVPLPKSEWSLEQTKKIIEQSRQRYAMPKSELESLLDAWQKRTFSPAERVTLRASLEGKGIAVPLIDKFFASWESDRDNWYKKQPTQELKNTVVPVVQQEPPRKQEITPLETPSVFSINDIILGQAYEGYIKLQFNYGLFVTVKGVEWLLHKWSIIAPDSVNWKKYFNIGDPITVIAQEFKEINGEKRVVWTMSA